MRVGILIRCATCGHTKKPIGRSAAMGTRYCDDECPGYRQPPHVGSLWPGETDAEFGFPIGPHGWREDDKHPAAVALGSLGGRVKSEKKAATSRANGKKGGRPPKGLAEALARVLVADATAGTAAGTARRK